jgi:hypothetical protein
MRHRSVKHMAALAILASLGVPGPGCSPNVSVFNKGPTCADQPEACDGLDNNCDGVVDEGCACEDGDLQPCYSGDPPSLDVGICTGGFQTCDAGQWGSCQGEILPEVELCDGLDNNCDGVVDEDLGMQTCGVGACQITAPLCMNGAPQECTPAPPTTEFCDGIDNNCDGAVDETDPFVDTMCDTGQPGACAPGLRACDGGALVCVPDQAPQAEACDGIDNDCNGQIDDGDPEGGAVCATGQLGVCAPGVEHCIQGALLCVPDASPTPEVCDALDNDCDGQVDSGPCGCNGTSACVNGQLVCNDPTTVYFEETFASNMAGWTLDATWGIGPAMASIGQSYGNPDPAADHTLTVDNGVAGVVIGGNAPTAQHEYYYLTSPVIDTSAAPAAYLNYWRWLNSDWAPYMTNHVQVFNGQDWVTLWASGGAPGVQDEAWEEITLDLTPHKNANMRFRFGYEIAAAGAFTVASWNIDDVLVTSAPCN